VRVKTDTKRQNFNITSEQEAEINWLKDALSASSAKDVIMLGVRVLGIVASEARRGRRLCFADAGGAHVTLVIPELEPASRGEWTYLVERPHPWRRQLYVKGRRVSAFTIWSDLVANGMTPDQAAANWDLPVAAIEEAVRYCEANKPLLEMEAEEERQRVESGGVSVGR
jgi:hypothetical protein